MKEKDFFTRQINIDITAATIGINKDDWYCYKPDMLQNDILNTMKTKKFDIVPIQNKSNIVKTFYTIESSQLKTNSISEDDKIYYLTHVLDVVWKMNKLQKTHFFLSNGRDENDIVGLLSLSNFNCREFYIFLFNIISYIEREFATLIKSDQKEAFKILEKCAQNDELKGQLNLIKDRFNLDVKNDNENDYKEYLYLSQIIQLIKEEKKYLDLGYSKENDFESGTGQLKSLRNNIAHPVKSLVRNLSDLSLLQKSMEKLFDFKERLDFYFIKNN